MKQFTAKHVFVIIALCGLMCNYLGVLYNLAGLFYAPVADSLGVGRGNVSMAQTIANLAAAGGALLAGKVAKSGKFKPIVLVCGIVFAGSTAALAACNSLMPMYVLSVLRGVSSGCAGTFLVTLLIGTWFEGSTGFLTSLIFCSSGLGGAIFSPILSGVIESSGWRSGYLAMAVIIAIMYLPSLVFPIAYRPQDCGAKPAYIGNPAKQAAKAAEGSSALAGGVFAFALIYACIASCETQYIGHFPGIADSYGHAAAVGSAMVSAAMMANTFGKLIFGAMTDKIGVKKGIFVYIACVTAGAAGMLALRGAATLYAAAALVGLCYPLSSVGSVLISKDLFGSHYGDLYPKVNATTTFVSAAVASGIGFIYDATGAYTLALLALLAGLGVQAVCVFTAYKKAGK